MLTEVNFEEYISRMESLSDKASLLDYIPEGSEVLDYGCGGGPLARKFAPGKYTGYDLSEMMVERARVNNPGYDFTSSIPRRKFDVVVLSSLLHEVFSYNGASRAAVVSTLSEVRELLRPDGVVVIRDGIQPHDSTRPVSLRLVNPEDAANFLTYLERESPWRFPVKVVDGKLEGLLKDVVNFLMVYTWGWGSAPREKEERVNFATFPEWVSILFEAGFTVEEADIVSQEDYFTHLGKLVDLEGLRWETKIFIKAAPVL